MEEFIKDSITQNIMHSKDGRTLRYDDFLNQIVKGDSCFICGANPGSKPFNNEHVIPNWILKAYG